MSTDRLATNAGRPLPSRRERLEQLIRRHYALLCTVAVRIVKGRDAAEDVVHQALFRVWKSDVVLDEETGLHYLLRAVRNEAISMLRTRRNHLSLDDVALPTLDAATVTAGVEEDDLLAAVATAIERLGPRSREIFRLSRDEGLTYAEIATSLGISVKTVETLMGRTLRQLRLAAAKLLAALLVAGIDLAL